MEEVKHASQSDFAYDAIKSTVKTPNEVARCDFCHESDHSVSQFPACMHFFCSPCLEKICASPIRNSCPKCKSEKRSASENGVKDQGATGSRNFSLSNGNSDQPCGFCGNGAVGGRCVQCSCSICEACISAHNKSHVIVKVSVDGGEKHPDHFNDQNIEDNEIECCQLHSGEPVGYFCLSCRQVLCQYCIAQLPCANHDYIFLSELHCQQNESLSVYSDRTRAKLSVLLESSAQLDACKTRTKCQYDDSEKLIERTFSFFLQALQERREELMSELKSVFTNKMCMLHASQARIVSNIEELNEAEVLINTLIPLPFHTKFIQLKSDIFKNVEELLHFQQDTDFVNMTDPTFLPNHQAIQTAVQNTFGYISMEQKFPSRVNIGIQDSTPKNCLSSTDYFSDGASFQTMGLDGNGTFDSIASSFTGNGGRPSSQLSTSTLDGQPQGIQASGGRYE